MGKALAACCLALVLCTAGWAQEPAPAPPAEQTQQATPQTPSASEPQPAEQPSAPAEAQPAPEQPPAAETPPAPAPPEAAPQAEPPAPQPAEQPSAPAEAQPAPEQPPAAETPPAPAQPAPEATEEAPAAPAEQPKEEETGPPITAIIVRGNDHIGTQAVMDAVTARVGGPFTPALAQEQEKAVRDLGWFYDVRVTSEPTEQGVEMVVNVVENPVLKGVAFEGNTVFTDEQLLAVIKTRPGEVSNNNAIRDDLRAVQDKYDKAGYIFARVVDVAIDQKTANLVITVVEGRVEEVRVTGNRKTKSYVITREMRTKPGAILNRNVLRRDLDRLINLGVFQDVSAQPTVGTAPGLAVVTVNVVEKKTGLAAAGVGYSSVQKLVGFVDVAESNLAGTGQKVTLRTEFGGRQSYELGYFNPWIAPPGNTLQVGVYNKLILREAFTQNAGFLYDEKRTGGNVTWSRPLGASETTRIYGTLRADSVAVRETEGLQLPPIIALQRAEDVRSLGLTLRNDTRNIIANPTQGGLNSVSLEFAGWLGGVTFDKFGIDLRRYLHAGGKRIFATRLLMGTTTGNPPFLEQYLIGGGETLRGYRQDRFPGTHMALVNTELRIPIQENIAGVLFVDVGDAWGGGFAADLGDTSFTPHVGYGVGARLVTPIGPIRVDYGIGSEGQETHFSVGHAF